MTKTPLVIGLASNTEDRNDRIEFATEVLRKIFSDVKVSHVYESPAKNGDGSIYCNAVLSGMTVLSEEAVVSKLKSIERDAGRSPDSKLNGNVPLDLDLVIWNGRIIRPLDFDQYYFNVGYRSLLAEGAFQYSI